MKTQDVVVAGILLWLLWPHPEPDIDVIIRDFEGNPIREENGNVGNSHGGNGDERRREWNAYIDEFSE